MFGHVNKLRAYLLKAEAETETKYKTETEITEIKARVTRFEMVRIAGRYDCYRSSRPCTTDGGVVASTAVNGSSILYL